MTWKERAHLRIAQVIAANPNVTDEKALRKLISDAYPFGERAYHPYKMWLTAVRETFEQPRAHNLPPRRPDPTDFTDTPLFGGAT